MDLLRTRETPLLTLKGSEIPTPNSQKEIDFTAGITPFHSDWGVKNQMVLTDPIMQIWRIKEKLRIWLVREKECGRMRWKFFLTGREGKSDREEWLKRIEDLGFLVNGYGVNPVGGFYFILTGSTMSISYMSITLQLKKLSRH